MKIGPGTVILNQGPVPGGGTVIAAPDGPAHEVEGMVWVQWNDRSVGEHGVSLEQLEDVTLTGKVVWASII